MNIKQSDKKSTTLSYKKSTRYIEFILFPLYIFLGILVFILIYFAMNNFPEELEKKVVLIIFISTLGIFSIRGILKNIQTKKNRNNKVKMHNELNS